MFPIACIPRPNTTLGAFSPTQISGLQAWYDASDLTTITKDGSDLVSQINDKSGNSRNATATTTARPTYTANYQNGKSALVFDGVANALSISDFSTILSTNKTIIIYAKQISVKAGGSGLFYESGNRPIIYLVNGSLQITYSGATGMPQSNENTNTYAISTNTNFSLVWQNNSNSYIFRVNKTTRESNAGTFGASTNAGAERIGTYNNGVFSNMAMYEYLIYNQALSLNQIQQVETYLLNKWGF